MRKISSFLIIAAAVTIATPANAKKKPELTPMELQALQSREFKAPKDQVFASFVAVFQDMGYQISQADMGSGFISAGSATTNKTSFWDALGGVQSSGASKATAFVEQMPSGYTRARLNFMNTKQSSSAWGRNSAADRPILDPKTYQVAFERIEQALFERGALTKTAPSTSAPTPAVPATPAATASPNQ